MADPKDSKDSKGGYTVGYKKPPHHTRFQKGRSGNPRGRPKGTPNFRTALETALKEQVTVNEGGRRTQISKLEAMVKQHVNRAVSGDARAREQLLRVLYLVDDSLSGIEPEATLDAPDEAVMRRLVERIRCAPTEEMNDETDTG